MLKTSIVLKLAANFIVFIQVQYLCTVAALCVVVVLGGQLTVCVFIRSYAVVVMLVIINAQI